MNDRSSVSRDYSSKSTERLFLCITANFGSSTYGMGHNGKSHSFGQLRTCGRIGLRPGSAKSGCEQSQQTASVHRVRKILGQ